MKFKGDIIITDPAYIDTVDSKLWDNPRIDIFTGGGISNEFGFTNYIWDTTLYGDWSCGTYRIKEEFKNVPIEELKEDMFDGEIGEFCADAGLVGVFLLEEVLNFNPEFNCHTKKRWTTTLIEDFDGYIDYVIHDDKVFIRGRGSVNFITSQSGY